MAQAVEIHLLLLYPRQVWISLSGHAARQAQSHHQRRRTLLLSRMKKVLATRLLFWHPTTIFAHLAKQCHPPVSLPMACYHPQHLDNLTSTILVVMRSPSITNPTTIPQIRASTPSGDNQVKVCPHILRPCFIETQLTVLDASDAMISNLSLATHPGLNISRHFRMDLPPSPAMAQQSITINLPSTHYYLQIKPTIAPSLLERQHKLFVTSGTQRLHAMPLIPGHPVDPRHPLFEARLLPGVNRIEVELIAALPKGAAKPLGGQDVELEKITVFANLLRA